MTIFLSNFDTYARWKGTGEPCSKFFWKFSKISLYRFELASWILLFLMESYFATNHVLKNKVSFTDLVWLMMFSTLTDEYQSKQLFISKELNENINFQTKSCFLKCDFKIWFHFVIPNHVFMIPFNYFLISSIFASNGSFPCENIEIFNWKHWLE